MCAVVIESVDDVALAYAVPGHPCNSVGPLLELNQPKTKRKRNGFEHMCDLLRTLYYASFT